SSVSTEYRCGRWSGGTSCYDTWLHSTENELRALSRNWMSVMTKTMSASARLIAVAYPSWSFWKPFCQMYQTMVAVENSGPPFGVMMLTSVNTCEPPMMLVTTRKN